jgi:glycosyltransferase involved in cell wall biosynthesis
MTKSIGMLLKVEIGSFNKKNVAGTEQIFIEDISSFAKKGYIVSAFARFSDPKIGISRINIPNFFYSLIRWLRAIKDRRYNLIYYGLRNIILTTIEIWYTWRFAKLTKECQVVIGYSTPTLALFRKKSVIIMQNAHHIFHFSSFFPSRYANSTYLFCSHWLLHSYLKKYPFLTKENSFVLHNAVDTKLFTPKPYTPDTHRKKLRLLFTGAWHKEKGLHLLLNSLLHLNQNQQNKVELLITSNENLWYSDFPEDRENHIRNLFLTLIKLGSMVSLVGGASRKKMPYYYRSADYLVMTSTWKEPFGLSALESIACGTPVISFGTGGLKEILSPANSIIIPPNQKSLNLLISKLVDKPIKLKSGKQLFDEKNSTMTLDKRLDNLIKHFDKVILQ